MSLETGTDKETAIINLLKIGAHEEGKLVAKYAKTEKDRLKFVFNFRLFAALQIIFLIAFPQVLAKFPVEKINNTIKSLNEWITAGNPFLVITVDDPWNLSVTLTSYLGIILAVWVMHNAFLTTVVLQAKLSSKSAYCRSLLDAAEQNETVRKYVQKVNASGRQLRYFDLAGAQAALEENMAKTLEDHRAKSAAEEKAACAKLHSL